MNRSKNQDGINWPKEFEPSQSPIHVRNELDIPVSPDVVWAWLIRAQQWPSWYPNAAKITYLNEVGLDLKEGTSFRWKTFGVSLKSTVMEYIPEQRIAWTAKGIGIWAYHAWLIRKTDDGCHVLTEETQHGLLCRLGKLIFPNQMHEFHQVWLEQLLLKAQSGFPDS